MNQSGCDVKHESNVRWTAPGC